MEYVVIEEIEEADIIQYNDSKKLKQIYLIC